MIEPGDTAPDFTLPDQHGNPVTLSDLRGQTVVLYFYPKADTPGSKSSNAVSLQSLRTGSGSFRELGTSIAGCD